MASSNECLPSTIYLVDYFIYCPLLSEKEGQEARKILYYYPSHRELDRQIRTVGYCEGLVQFTETFAFDDPCQSVHFQKSRLLFYQAEQDICLSMTLHVPVIEHTKDDKSITAYYDEQINDRLMLPLLRMSYRFFLLQYGTMSAFIHNGNVEKLRNVLQQHFDKFIEYHLHRMIRDVTIDSSYFGIQFLSVDKRIYLKFQTILRRLELRLTSLKETMLIHRDQLIWTGLDQDDTVLIYSFFRHYYWPHIKTLPYISTMRYLTVDSGAIPADELIISTNLTSQEFYLGNLSTLHQMLVIHSNLFTIFCILDNDDDLSDHDKISSIVELFNKDLETILPDFEEYLRRRYPTTDNTVKNVYFNKINMAYSATAEWNRESNSTIQAITSTLAEDLQWYHPAGEIMVKRENDPWIVAKRSDMRELLLIVNHKAANLKEINDKVKQLFSTQFNNILLLK